ncbi:hypothetical protein V5799_006699 [Amblyomma americanum]|uniref:Uncharacterized protein n=2 Tax=Amblyomma americanum TaxID=6943 RepID=A0AAQ4DVN0_AMBAM
MESTTTPLDEEQCPVDEYPDSKEVMRGIQNTDPMWFGALTSGPQSVEQKRSPQEVNVLTDQRKAATESRRIEKSGGYVFQNQAGPPPFRSGGTPFRQQLNFLWYASIFCLPYFCFCYLFLLFF